MVGDVDGEDFARARDGDAAARALGEVDILCSSHRSKRNGRMPLPTAGADGKPLVLLTQPLFPDFAAALEGRYRLVLAADADAATAGEVRVLLVPGLKVVTAELIGRLPALELVVATSVGVDHVDLDACRRRGIAVTNAGAAFSVDSADYAVGLLVAVLRRVAAAEAYLRRGRWATDGKYPLATKVSLTCQIFHTTSLQNSGLLHQKEMALAPPTQEAAASGYHQDGACKPLVLLADPLIPEFEPELSARYRLLPVVRADAATVAWARALLTVDLPAVTADLIDALPALELVVASSAGLDHIDLAACRRRGIRVTNAGGAYSADAADYAVGLVVAALRGVPAADAYVRRGGWVANGEYPLANKVSGKRVGIVGLGRIGSLVARRLAAFGCPVAYHSRSPKPSSPYKFFPTVRALAADSDVLVLSCALTEETRHMVNREVMEALGKDGVLVNVGRGGLVDEPELVRCLREGVIGGAGLDVYDKEPDVPTELFAMENVVLSDHRAVITPESIGGALDIVSGNLEAFFAGKALLSPVTL
ncbi:Glyoxylate/hydroxypyruvate reductase HPR3 [Dichanthelium oligosanthes]|uniref:Glyoxylate/hydroxypyruvate reductase HPR3 n=1 Tax=Dichanthelium oligosanthes TaxID=888268 RepID=A0A1E5V2R0_9POAL|nr:Glyoxylate/hydroxypyruvate reductase HPR3 [Dichanthelium oligosanthes]